MVAQNNDLGAVSQADLTRSLVLSVALANCSRGNREIKERLRFTFTPNGKREFVPRDQVSPLTVGYFLLLPLKSKSFHASFIRKNCSIQFLSACFLF